MTLAPSFLEGRGHPDEQYVGLGRADLLDDAHVSVSVEVTVAIACNLDPGMLCFRAIYQRRDDLEPRAKEVDTQPMLGCDREQARHQVYTCHPFRNLLA